MALYSRADYNRDMDEAEKMEHTVSAAIANGVLVDMKKKQQAYEICEIMRKLAKRQLMKTRFILQEGDHKRGKDSRRPNSGRTVKKMDVEGLRAWAKSVNKPPVGIVHSGACWNKCGCEGGE